ncbi:MAG: RluA family pseudouridine synthase [Phycisphaerales bacterium]|nr:RluA family pseudouridine synthase [Phycisphaerales bacterium]
MQGIQPNPRVTFRVAHQDDSILVVEKPPRVVTLPGLGHEHDTLLNGLFAAHGNRLAQLGRERSFGLLHRLDRETSGLVIVALSVQAYDGLFEQFKRRAIGKFYWAVCQKAPREPSGVIRFPIEEIQERASRWVSMKKSRVSNAGRPALTAYRVLESNDLAALIEARPVTGRLHQVRVHLAAIGSGILGDDWYGPRATSEAAARLALHAHRLRFTHPISGQPVDVRTRWPGDLRRLLTRLHLHRPDLKPASDETEHEFGGGPVGEEDPSGAESDD